MTRGKKMAHGAGTITALWASAGLAILGATAHDSLPGLSIEDAVTALSFVAGVWGAGYLLGGVFLAQPGIGRRLWVGAPVALGVSALTLILGGYVGAGGYLSANLALGQLGSSDVMQALTMPLVLGLWGVLFYGPLSLGLALHVRIWHGVIARRARRERPDIEVIAETFR